MMPNLPWDLFFTAFVKYDNKMPFVNETLLHIKQLALWTLGTKATIISEIPNNVRIDLLITVCISVRFGHCNCELVQCLNTKETYVKSIAYKSRKLQLSTEILC